MSKVTNGFNRVRGMSTRLAAASFPKDSFEIRANVEQYHKNDGYRDVRIVAEKKGLDLKTLELKVLEETAKIAEEIGLRIYVERREFEDSYAGLFGYIDISIWKE